ncbi:MAG: hypothetical protein WCT37_05610 [Patescibacteria group bacterium]|jgi:hypothetical protein
MLELKTKIYLTLGAVILLAAGVLVFSRAASFSPAPEFSLTRNDQAVALPAELTAGWQTYQSSDFTWQIKHPADWQVLALAGANNQTVFVAPDAAGKLVEVLTVKAYPKTADLKQFTQPLLHLVEENRLNLRGLPVLEKVYYGPGPDGQMLQQRWYIISGKNYLYVLNGAWCDGEMSKGCEGVLGGFGEGK